MSPDFFRDCGRILAQEPGNILKGSALIQFVFDIDTIFKGKVFWLPGIYLLMISLLLLLSEGEITIPWMYERVNINCAEVSATAPRGDGI